MSRRKPARSERSATDEGRKARTIVKRIGITEFDGRIAEVWEGEPIAIERNGRLIGYYIPVGWNRALDREAALDEAFARFEAALARARGKRHD